MTWVSALCAAARCCAGCPRDATGRRAGRERRSGLGLRPVAAVGVGLARVAVRRRARRPGGRASSRRLLRVAGAGPGRGAGVAARSARRWSGRCRTSSTCSPRRCAPVPNPSPGWRRCAPRCPDRRPTGWHRSSSGPGGAPPASRRGARSPTTRRSRRWRARWCGRRPRARPSCRPWSGSPTSSSASRWRVPRTRPGGWACLPPCRSGVCLLPAFLLLGVVPTVASLFGSVAP